MKMLIVRLICSIIGHKECQELKEFVSGSSLWDEFLCMRCAWWHPARINYVSGTMPQYLNEKDVRMYKR